MTLRKIARKTVFLVWRGRKAFRRLIEDRANRYLYGTGGRVKYGNDFYVGEGIDLVFADNVRFGDRVRITTEKLPCRIKVGSNVTISDDVKLDCSGDVEIEDETHISAHVRIYTHDHGLDPRSQPTTNRLKVGRRVWIGYGATIMQGVENIGEHSVVGAEAVVSKEIGSGQIVAGNPAKVVGKVP